MECCVVCNQESHGHHFGVQACRACSSFFRRSIAERKVYKCRREKQCLVKNGLRNICRACRLKNCLDAGMRGDVVQGISNTKNLQLSPDTTIPCSNDINVIPTPSPSTSFQTSLLSPDMFDNPFQYPTLHRLLQGIRTYLSSQKSLFTVENPNRIFTEPKFVLVKKSEYDKLERCCISLIYSMLNEFFVPFNLFNHEQKIAILKTFAKTFSILNKCFLSSKIYPNKDDTRYAMNYGYYMDKNNMPYFFSEFENPEELIQLCAPLIVHCRELINKFVKYDIHEVDVASLSYIIFSLECEKLSLHTDVIENHKNIVFGEMHANYVKNFGYEQGGIKFANVLCLLHDIMDLNNHIYESLAIGKIFVPEFLDVWDEMS